jgi:hypothetical protein
MSATISSTDQSGVTGPKRALPPERDNLLRQLGSDVNDALEVALQPAVGRASSLSMSVTKRGISIGFDKHSTDCPAMT